MKKIIYQMIAIGVLCLFVFSPAVSAGLFELEPSWEDFFMSKDQQAPPLRASIADIAGEFYDASDLGVDEKMLPSSMDITKHLMNTEMDYQRVWEPWLTKAAVRCIVTDPSNEFLAVGGGYLYDNEIHIYRWNGYTREYDKVWDSGDEIIQGDVLSIAFGDTDNNDFMEIAAGSADGHVYVFEQEHIYDPYDNMENQFVHVWTSPKIQQVWGVAIADVDKDYLPDVIAGSWDKKIHVYEYTNHSGYPFNDEHWIEYTEKASINVGEKIFSLSTGDTNYNALPEIVVGTELGRVYIYENNGTILQINGKPWPLTQDNSYRYHWDSGNVTWKPVLRVIVDNLDDDEPDEIAYIAVGQDTVVINYEDLPVVGERYLTHRLWAPLESWQLGGFEGLGHYLNHYIDFMTWSNNEIPSVDTFNAYTLSSLNSSMLEGAHVYYVSVTDDVLVPEPHAYGWEPQWPKNTSMAIHRKLDPWGENGVYIDMNGDNIVDDTEIGGIRDINHPPAENYTVFNARNTYASAIVDWGNDQEVMGDGLFAIPEEGLGYDVILRFNEWTLPQLNKISFEVSRGDGQWALVSNDDISLALVSSAPGDDDLQIDIDPLLSEMKWSYFRYMRINVTNHGYFMIKGGYAPVLYRPMDAATSLTIGSLDLDYYKAYTSGESEGKKIVLGTSDGKIIMFEYDATAHSYNLLWNSYTNDSYTQGTNIWDIVEVQSPGKIPTWLFNETKSQILRDDWEVPVSLDEKIALLETEQFGAPNGFYGELASVTHISLFSAFFNAIFESVPAFEPFQDIFELNIPENDMVIGTTNGKLIVVPELTHELSELAQYFFLPVNINSFYNQKSISPRFVDFNSDQDYFPEIMLLGWASNLPGELYDPAIGTYATAGLDVYTYDPLVGPLGMYTGKFELKDLEITGLLARALQKSQRMPETAVGDVDGDGDQDIVLTNGRIYFIENINNIVFILDPDYFEDLNTKATNKLFDSPELYDYDGDGDLDLTVGWSNRQKTIVSTTYFENVGYRWAPHWEENKWLYTNSWGGLRFNNLTHAAFAYDKTGKVSHITTYNTHTHQLIQLYAEYDNHNAYVIGTNPLIARLEINLKSGTDSHLTPIANYGYHVFETWTSEAELERWTLTLETGDLDQDGRGEVIVGDFDNNLYVFEHLTNNTFKRAYRSQDITHTELSTQSPYAWDQLEGVSGTFYRTIWDHIEELVVGLDMDNDGFLEMVATAGLSVFVWEQRNNGFVSVDDEYTLIWQADLRQSAWAPFFQDLGITQFTAAAYGGDLDYNGYGEFVLAAGSFLFVFESNGADQFYENFLVDPYPVRGRYFIPGNPLSSETVKTLSIESIVVADTDNDTFNEIILGGVNKTWWGQYNGFVAILENQVGTYAYSWWAPMHLMEDNPVYDIEVDNQDYDEYKEIIVGTFKGIVIYENSDTGPHGRDNFYLERSILTSFVNFPYMKLKQMFDVETKVALALRNTDFIELQYDMTTNFRQGQWLQIFKGGSHLYYATSNDFGDTWIQHGRVTTTNLLSRVFTFVGGYANYPMAYSSSEMQPSLFQTRDGRVFLAFSGSLTFSSYTRVGIWLLELKENAGTIWWENAIFNPSISEERAVAIDGSSHYLYNPSVWAHSDNVAQGVAISYMNVSTGGIYWQYQFTTGLTPPQARIPNIGYSAVNNNLTWGRSGYRAISHDAIRSTSGDVVIVFTGMKFEEAKIDYDLWIAKSNSSTMWEEVFPYSRATSDAIDELHPSITQTITPDRTLMVIFEADGNLPSGALQVTYSKDDGNTWREPESVTTTPPFATYRVFPLFGFSLMVLKENPNIVIKSLISVGPAITPHFTGGFAYSFMSQYDFYSLASFSVTKYATNALTANLGYSSSVSGSVSQLSTGDISAHSGLVEVVGGSMTTGGGQLSYQDEVVGSFFNLTAGGGSGLSYVSSSPPTPIVYYDAPIVTEEEGIVAYGGNLVAYGDDATGSDNPGSDTNTGYASTGRLFETNFGADFHRPEKDRGYYNNIFFGINPSSDFTKFDFKEARAIAIGDSDKDYRREIAVASGSQAYLVEVSKTGGNWNEHNQVLEYYQSWQTDSFVTQTTDIAMYDTNGNGMDEVIVSCLQGNVYSFEGMVTDPPVTDILYVDNDLLWQNDSYQGGFWTRDPSPEVLLVETDVNNDGYDDVLLGLMDPDSTEYNGYPVIQALDGPTGDEFWVFNLSTSQHPLSKNSAILWMKTHDLNADGRDDLIFLAFDYDAQTAGSRALWLYGLIVNEIYPVESWVPVFFNYSATYELNGFVSADMDGDLVLDILIALSNDVYWIRGIDGNDEDGPYLFYNVGDSDWNVEHISEGNKTLLFSSRDTLSSNGTVAYVDINGTIIQEYQFNNTEFGLTAVQMPLTDDAHEDILILESGVMFAFDGLINRSQQLWNMSIDESIGNYEDTLKYDFNDDSYEDVMFQVMGTSGSFTYTGEDFFSGERVAHKIEGLTFSDLNDTALQGWTVANLSSSQVTPHSGDMMFYTFETDNFITIESGAYIVSAWFGTGTGYLYDYVWTAYDINGNFLSNTTFAHSTPIQYAELRDPLGRIYSVKVSSTGPTGWEGYWAMDDFSYESFGPTKLMAFSGVNLQESLWEYYLWNSYTTHIVQGDLDDDGQHDDLLFSTVYQGNDYPHTGELKVVDGSEGTPLFFYEFGGFIPYYSLGNFAEFGDIAVLTPSGFSAMLTYIRHEPTHYRNIAVQMDDSVSFETRGIVTRLAVGDFNADGFEDIIFGDRARYLIALNGLNGDMIWKYRVSSPISQVAVKDFHLQDGYSDVAIALMSGLLVVINGETGRPIWEDYLGPVIVNSMKFIDVNQDGRVEELGISLGFRFTHLWGRFDLYNVTMDTLTGRGSIIWQRYQPFAPFTQFEAADFRGIGKLDIAVAIYEHSIWILDWFDGSFIRAFPVTVHDFAIGTFDPDQSLPMIAVIVRNGTVATYRSNDWTSSVVQAGKINLYIPFRLSHMTVGDFNNNGEDEIVVHSFGEGSFLLNGKLSNVLWFFEDRSTFYFPRYLVADMNNDGIKDILSLNHDNIFALDGVTGEVVWASFVPSYVITAMIIADFDDDGISDVAVGTADKWIYVLHGKIDIIIPQEDPMSGKLIKDSPDGNTRSLIPDFPLISDTNKELNLEQLFITFFTIFGVLILPTMNFIQRRYRK